MSDISLRDAAQDDKRRCVLEQARREERAAFKRLRAAERLQRARGRAAGKAWRRKLAEVIIDTRSSHPSCTCDLRFNMNRDDLRDLNAGCTAGRYVCPRLDAVRRRLGL